MPLKVPASDLVRDKVYDFTSVRSDIKHTISGCPALPTTEPSEPQDTLTIQIPNDPTGKVTGWACLIQADIVQLGGGPGPIYDFNNTVFKAVKNGVDLPARSTGTSTIGVPHTGVHFECSVNVQSGDVIGVKAWSPTGGGGLGGNFVFVYYRIVPVSFDIEGLIQINYDAPTDGAPLAANCTEEIPESVGTRDYSFGPDITSFGATITLFSTWNPGIGKVSSVFNEVSVMTYSGVDGATNTCGFSYIIRAAAYCQKISAFTTK
jgi:hypothetical protein